jgi:FkbM family methyltransferase
VKDINQTVLELVAHLSGQHPELRSALEKVIFADQQKNLFDANLLLALKSDLLIKSKAQLRQDIFVLEQLNYKKEGFFIEFGATNGIDLSNTYLLEKSFAWSGILAEPAKLWHENLLRNRTCQIDTRCVWSKTGEVIEFNQTEYAELSTAEKYTTSDYAADSRKSGLRYPVETVSLMDLLAHHGAPREIDYLSIDTEGSEYEILSKFDFTKYRIKVITCEHNYTPMREKLFELFSKNGYKRKHEDISQFDDWYVLDI